MSTGVGGIGQECLCAKMRLVKSICTSMSDWSRVFAEADRIDHEGLQSGWNRKSVCLTGWELSEFLQDWIVCEIKNSPVHTRMSDYMLHSQATSHTSHILPVI